MKTLNQRHDRKHNDGKVTSMASLLGMPVELSNGIAVQTKHENNNRPYEHSGLWASKLVVWEVLHGEQNLNSSQQVWCVGIQVELILDWFKLYDFYIK